ncbi:DUF3341 domain-containing protein [bacterium]|nr:DUF3341 domain-containing protein [bacterium]
MSDKSVTPKTEYGVVARFEDPGALLHAAEKVRDAGYTKFDCHSPFPIHGMDQAMGLKQSKVGLIAGAGATFGFILGLWLQWWTSTIDYPIVIAGKPFFSYQAYVPVTFGLTVLFGAIGAVAGMFHVNRMPQWFHGVFHSENFARFSDDAFFVSIEKDDPKYDRTGALEFLKSIGGAEPEVLEGE